MIQSPVIITLQIDKYSQEHFNEMRKQYFPAERNYLEAHITLFHQLPDAPFIHETLANINLQSFEITLTPPFHTGFGVAYGLRSKVLLDLHQKLSGSFLQWLIPQDKKPFKPHITVQNKVSAEASKQLTAQLQKSFVPFTIKATGLQSWLYKNGPWSALQSYAFL